MGLIQKRFWTEESVVRLSKKSRALAEVVVQNSQKPEVYLKVKWNYLF